MSRAGVEACRNRVGSSTYCSYFSICSDEYAEAIWSTFALGFAGVSREVIRISGEHHEGALQCQLVSIWCRWKMDEKLVIY
jgi:hypothetical protein